MMDSFLSLFDPNDNIEEISPADDFSSCKQLPPEPQHGNIEYKLKLVNPSKVRFQHLVTQLKWRLREGQGEAIYEIGVGDDGALAGLHPDDLAASLDTLGQMALKLGATCTVLRERLLDNSRRVAEVLVRKVPDDQHSIEVRIAVMGSADAGKSTLLGVLTQGQLDNGRGSARLNMFRHLHEVQSGRTSSISHEILGFNSQGEVVNYRELLRSEEICEVSAKLVTFMDLAGHRKYLKTTVAGLTGYMPHYSMIVVSGSAGVSSMTLEHLAIIRALNLPFFVVITKTDVTSPEFSLQSLKTMLTTTGVNKIPFVVSSEDDVITAGSNQQFENIVPIFCVSNVTGDGLELVTKFLHVLPPRISLKEKERLEQDPCEFQVDETFRIPIVGTIVGGLLLKGAIVESKKLLIGPFDDGTFIPVTVQTMHRNKRPCRMVAATQAASLGFTQEIAGIRNGMVLVSPDVDPVGAFFFQARVCVLFHATSIHKGFQATVHIGNIRQTAIIEGVMPPHNGIQTNETASVLFRFVRHPEYVRVGMRLLFREGRTKGVGTVTQVFPCNTSAA